MAKRSRSSDDFDSPWKDALQAYFPFFLAFFYPDIHTDVDWSRGYESLDKEFQQIIRQAKRGKALADKLFKVWLKDGSEYWLLIHVEVQADYDVDFAERMFNYNVAAYRLYNQTIVSLAVLCDDRPNWRPDSFEYGKWGSLMKLRFLVAKLLDHGSDPEGLEKSDNPFACVVLAHLLAMQTRHDPESRRQMKLRIVKGLFVRKWSKEDIRKLFGVIDWILTLPDELQEGFRTDFYQFEEDMKMPYMSSIERYGFEKGLEEGIQKGRQEGIQKGRQEGIQKGRQEGIQKGRQEGAQEGERKGLLAAISLDLAKFGRSSRKILQQAQTVSDVAKLHEFLLFLKKAKTLDEVRGFFSN